MPSFKLPKLKSIFTNNSCRCGPNATDIINPTPKLKPSFYHQKPESNHPSDTSPDSIHPGGGKFAAEDHTSTTLSVNTTSPSPSEPCGCPMGTTIGPITVSSSGCPKLPNSLPVVQDSDDPYGDFRRSMLRMIFENEIRSRDDLQLLLDCFLHLNSPLHHQVIVRAFLDILDDHVFAGDDSGGE